MRFIKKILKGFTLMEILLVVAIIMVLAGVVLIAVSSSRAQANDAAVKEDVKSASGAIELYFAANGSYGPVYWSGTCPTASNPPDPVFYTDTDTRNAIADMAGSNGGGDVPCATGGSNADAATTWAIASPLKSLGVTGQYWCTDSSGKTKLSIIPSKSILARVIGWVVPTAHALVSLPGPWLGGGSNPAVCP